MKKRMSDHTILNLNLLGRVLYDSCVLNDKEFRKATALEENKKETHEMCLRYVKMYLRYM